MEVGLLGIGGFLVGAWAGRGFPLTWLHALLERRWP